MLQNRIKQKRIELTQKAKIISYKANPYCEVLGLVNTETLISFYDFVATEKPIVKDIAIKIAVFPRAAAPSSVIPTLPTITLSTNPTRVCPNIPNMTG